MDMYENRMTGETRTKEGWHTWAVGFYNALAYDEHGRDTYVVKHLNVLMPKDWWERTQKVLKLELIG